MTPSTRRILYILFYIITCAILSGCAHGDGTQVKYHVESANYLNPDINGQASPVVLTLYQLKATGLFDQLDYNQLASNTNDALKDILVDKANFQIPPNDHQIFKQQLSSNTHFIGVTAAYRTIDSAHWRKIIAVPPHLKYMNLNIHLESQNIQIKNDT